MRYAIAVDGDQVSPHFGRCEQYVLIDVADGEVAGRRALPNPGHEPDRLPRLLAEHGVNGVVAGGAGRRAMGLLTEMGIPLCLGVSGTVEDAIAAIAAGTLAPGESTCEH